jgi:processive 1,2-diacylglycerol beta-glucosyltransferase
MSQLGKNNVNKFISDTKLTMIYQNKTKESEIKIAAYTADPWENVLPRLRLIDPTSLLDITLLRGNDINKNEFHPEFISQANAIYIQRDFPRFFEWYNKLIELAIEHNKPIIFDIDDLLFDISKIPNPKEADYFRPAIVTILDLILRADLIITSTNFLKQLLYKFNKNVKVLPNFLNDKLWDFRDEPIINEHEQTIIGYCGTRSHIPDIEYLEPVISFFNEIYGSKVSFYLWIETLPTKLMRYENVHWKPVSFPNYEEYANWMKTISPDIWIAPLINNDFNRAKSPIKYLEYSTLGIPGIFSAIEPYQEIINHDKNGFLANTIDDWQNLLELLINNPLKRQQVGKEAINTIKEDWLLSNKKERISDTFQVPRTKNYISNSYYEAFKYLNKHYSYLINTSNELDKKNHRINDLENLSYERSQTIDILNSKIARINYFLQIYHSVNQFRKSIINFYHNIIKVLKNWLEIDQEESQYPSINQINLSKVSIQTEIDKPLNIALYTSDNWETASAHIRLIGPSNHLQSNIKVLNGCKASTFPDMKFFIQADAIVIQRDFPRYYEHYKLLLNWAQENNKPIIYEIDDILYNLPNEHPEKEYFRPFEILILQAIKYANSVVVSTSPLASEIRKYNKNTWILPNYLDDNIWKIRSKASDNQIKNDVSIGYMGGITKTHLPDITSILDALNQVQSEFKKNITFHFWGVVPESFLANSNVIFHSRKFPDYRIFADYFSNQEVDFFIAPLISNSFNDCKSAIKYLEYSSLSIPGIYSDVYPYREIISQEQNGYLASSKEDWLLYMNTLIKNPSKRRKIGLAAQTTVKDLYLLSRHAHEWGEIYQTIIENAYQNS